MGTTRRKRSSQRRVGAFAIAGWLVLLVPLRLAFDAAAHQGLWKVRVYWNDRTMFTRSFVVGRGGKPEGSDESAEAASRGRFIVGIAHGGFNPLTAKVRLRADGVSLATRKNT